MSLPATHSSRRIADVEAAFREHHVLVLAVLRRFGVPERELHDALQEVFIVVHRRLPEFEGRASLSTWLYRIARNVASDFRRKACHRHEHLSESGALPETSGELCTPDGERAELERVLRVVERLPEPQREVFVLYELLELSMREVAARVRCPLKTAFTRLYAARRQLALELERGHFLGGLLFAFRPGRLRLSELAPQTASASLLPAVAVAALCLVLPPAAAPEPARGPEPTAVAARSLPVALAAPALPIPSAKLSALTDAPKARPVGAARPARPAAMALRSAAAASAPETPAREPEVVELAVDEDLAMFRTSAADPHPTQEHPFASRLPALPAPPRHIYLKGPEDPALALERALSGER
jgi:RNA polymerase sigma-70 factor (ECF subfamily)